MADQKISQLSATVTPSLSDVFPIVNQNQTRKISLQNLSSQLSSIHSSAFLTLSGGTVSGNLTVNGRLSASSIQINLSEIGTVYEFTPFTTAADYLRSPTNATWIYGRSAAGNYTLFSGATAVNSKNIINIGGANLTLRDSTGGSVVIPPHTTAVVNYDRLSPSLPFQIIGTTPKGIDVKDLSYSGTKLNYETIPVGQTVNTICAGNDSRLTDARTPTSHASSHYPGGTDPLVLSQLGAVALTDKGIANGVASLDATGRIPIAQIPSDALNVIELTYSQIKTLQSTSGLRPGARYVITDFELKWWNQSVNDTTVKSSGVIEPLIVTAVNPSQISHIAYSQLYPDDIVYYDIDAISSYTWGTINTTTAIPNFRGWIYRRINTTLNIDIGWDWRYITSNCCRPNLNSIPLYNQPTTYSRYAVVKTTEGKLYFSTKDNNNDSSISTAGWMPVSPFVEANTYFPTNEANNLEILRPGGIPFISLPFDLSARIQQPTFTSSLTNQGTSTLLNCRDLFIAGGFQNVFLGSSIRTNTINTRNFSFNIINETFTNNVVLKPASTFSRNFIGSGMFGNTFDNNSSNNSFISLAGVPSISTNIFRGSINNNIINTRFQSNIIESTFTQNSVGSSFINNRINNTFQNNLISTGASLNQINNLFQSNLIQANFRNNIINAPLVSLDLTLATLVYNNYEKTIFTNSNNSTRLRYFNTADQLIVADLSS